MTTWRPRLQILNDVETEIALSQEKHGPCNWSRHEFYGVLMEEIDELWDVIKTDGPSYNLINELRQVIAVCFQYYDKENE